MLPSSSIETLMPQALPLQPTVKPSMKATHWLSACFRLMLKMQIRQAFFSLLYYGINKLNIQNLQKVFKIWKYLFFIAAHH